MKKAAVVKDAFRNMPHLVVIEEDSKFTYIPITEFGKKIAAESVSDFSFNKNLMPDGFISTGFKSLTPEIESLMRDNVSENIQTKTLLDKSQIDTNKANQKLNRVINSYTFASLGISEKSLSHFYEPRNKETIIGFKTRLFTNRVKTSSIISSIKSGRIGINTSNMEVVYKDSDPIGRITAHFVKEYVPSGVLKRSFRETREHSLYAKPRRMKRRVKSLSSGLSKNEAQTLSSRILISSLSRIKK